MKTLIIVGIALFLTWFFCWLVIKAKAHKENNDRAYFKLVLLCLLLAGTACMKEPPVCWQCHIKVEYKKCDLTIDTVLPYCHEPQGWRENFEMLNTYEDADKIVTTHCY